MSSSVDTPVLIFDGQCAFCHHWSHSLARVLSKPPRIVSSASIDYQSLGLSDDDVTRAVWLVTPRHQWSAAAAIAAIFRGQPEFRWRFLGHLLDTWPISIVAELVYKVVAASRRLLPAPQTTCKLPHD